MNYEEARGLVQDGDLIAFRGAWFTSRLIRWVRRTEPDVSHVGIACWARLGTPRLCVFESVGNGVRLMPLRRLVSWYRANRGRVFWRRLHDESKREALVRQAQENWGRPYPKGHLRQYLWTLFGRRTDVDPEGLTCSEFVARCMQDAKVHDWLEPATVEPCEVAASEAFDGWVELAW